MLIFENKNDVLTRPSAKLEAGIYIHLPFCAYRCGYCDFYSTLNLSMMESYVSFLKKELLLYQKEKEMLDFTTLYLGGGTPSLFPDSKIAELISFLEQQHFLDKVQEITIEVNPEQVSESKMKFYRSLGINRLSLGVQSFQDSILKLLERKHTKKDNLDAIELANRFFDNYSLDFMSGIASQNLEEELDLFTQISPPHLSVYSLTLYEKTKFFYQKIPYQKESETVVSELKHIHETLSKKDYSHYELTSYSKNNRFSKHNLHYWERRHYLGIGASASGYLGKVRYKNHFLKGYLDSLKKNEKPVVESEILTTRDDILEFFMLEGRLNKAMNIDKYFYLKEFFDILVNRRLMRKKSNNDYKTTIQFWIELDSLTQELNTFLGNDESLFRNEKLNAAKEK